jgi:SnoaL-like protein
MTTLTNQTNQTAAVIDRFNRAFLEHRAELLDDLVAPDCVMETIEPIPDGNRHEGGDVCVHFWTELANDRSSWFELEQVDVLDDRAIIRWRFHFGPEPDASVRGVNLMHVRDGRIVEALGYAKSGEAAVADALPAGPG